jgi:hypothetical protein
MARAQTELDADLVLGAQHAGRRFAEAILHELNLRARRDQLGLDIQGGA